MPKQHLEIYTDGACRDNPGPGGWAALLIYGKNEKILSGGAADTTNNRMELQAAISGLAAVRRRCPIRVYTDSKYVKDGIEEWLSKWKVNGWVTAAKKPVKNEDLWRELDCLVTDLGKHEKIEWHWVKGHSGHTQNERVDQLARAGIPDLDDD